MLVQVNSGSKADVGADQVETIETRVRERLGRFSDRLTRVEVHIEDEDGDRNGPRGIAVRMEARPAGGAPQFAAANGRDVDAAAADALGKLANVLDRGFGKQDGR